MRSLLDGPYASPSALQPGGREARAVIDRARGQVADLLGAAPDEVVLMSGGSEANNAALVGPGSRDRTAPTTSSRRPSSARRSSSLPGSSSGSGLAQPSSRSTRPSSSTPAARVGVRPSTAKRHLADLRARSGRSTEQLICRGRAEGWLVVPGLELR
jgi:hypothetical protein